MCLETLTSCFLPFLFVISPVDDERKDADCNTNNQEHKTKREQNNNCSLVDHCTRARMTCRSLIWGVFSTPLNTAESDDEKNQPWEKEQSCCHQQTTDTQVHFLAKSHVWSCLLPLPFELRALEWKSWSQFDLKNFQSRSQMSGKAPSFKSCFLASELCTKDLSCVPWSNWMTKQFF